MIDDLHNVSEVLERCEVCGWAKKIRIFKSILPCVCKCEEDAYEKQKADRELAERVRRNTAEAYRLNPGMKDCVSIKDDRKRPTISKACKAYGEKFNGSKPDKWLLLFGDVGTGKTFMAVKIMATALSFGRSALIATPAQIERLVWNAQNKEEAYEKLRSYDLLVIDDFGACRDTSYMYEVMFNVIDDREKNNAATVITTNLTRDDFLKPESTGMKRIVSRIFGKSIPLEFTGADRRIANIFNNCDGAIEELLNG